ncbi:fructokinase [Pedobacter cryoconitis]|uniref:PfkB family carbohydrate kinase n=1 Tax=Pedobacter cryoconitis TaxID=188932 RepID=UPI00161C351C|nr:PfkB family carbohydrate kinase [Pedobacter cryoconitis]MBB6270295.1 fructokinase [Pedobacter cryoconitis]
MSAENKKPVIICYGEILWDNLPADRMAGGAPVNVAYHLNHIGAESKLISRTGEDKAGAELVCFCSKIGLPTELIQFDELHDTGEVIGKVTDDHEMVYDILPHVAWDFIEFNPKYSLMASTADAFVFGSLAERNNESRETLLQILDSAKYKVFDVNLRPPHYTKETLQLLLSKTDLLKLNINELNVLTDWFCKPGTTEAGSISYLQQNFSIDEILLTKGSQGAVYYNREKATHGNACRVNVADTVGAGDAFLAAFLYKKLTGTSIPDALDYALALGAFVAGQTGACPAYTTPDLDKFIRQHLRDERLNKQ